MRTMWRTIQLVSASGMDCWPGRKAARTERRKQMGRDEDSQSDGAEAGVDC